MIAHLQQSQRFAVLDRDNMAEISQEAKMQGAAQALRGASFVVTGDISEFGRKEVGDRQFFGLLDLAMREAVNNLVAGRDGGQWGPGVR